MKNSLFLRWLVLLGLYLVPSLSQAASESPTEQQSCRATYSAQTQTAYLPCVAVVDASGSLQAPFYAVEMQQVPQTDPVQFSISQMVEVEAWEGVEEDGCRAIYRVEEGVLEVPCVEVMNSAGRDGTLLGEMELYAVTFMAISMEPSLPVQFVLTKKEIIQSDLAHFKGLRAHNNSYLSAIGGSCPRANQYIADQWNFYKCECTSYVAWKLNNDGVAFTNSYRDVHWSDAKTWRNAAKSLSISVDNTPRRGDVAWWGSGSYGHVAYVDSVNSDGSVNISEYNQRLDHQYTTRANIRAEAYIHLSGPASGLIVEDLWVKESPIYAGTKGGFDAQFKLKNISSNSITIEKVAMAIHNANNTVIIDMGPIVSNVLIQPQKFYQKPFTAVDAPAAGQWKVVAKVFQKGQWIDLLSKPFTVINPAPTLSDVKVDKTTVKLGETLTISWTSENQYQYGLYLYLEDKKTTFVAPAPVCDGGKQGCLSIGKGKNSKVPWTVPTNLPIGKYAIKVVVWNSDDSKTAKVKEDFTSIFTVNASSTPPTTGGSYYYNDFRDVPALAVQTFLESQKGDLKDQKLYSRFKMDASNFYSYYQTEKNWNLPEIRKGVATMSPANIIYYSAKENNINPVLLLAKMQQEQSLIEQPATQDKLNRATGYKIPNSNPAGEEKSKSFLAQLTGLTFQFDKSRKEGKTFRAAYDSYTQSDKGQAGQDASFNTFNTIYNKYAQKMKEIVSSTPSSTRYNLTINADANGIVTSDSGNIKCGNGNSVCSASLDANVKVTLTATPTSNTGYSFSNWTGCSSTSSSCLLTMDNNKNVKANFVALTSALPTLKEVRVDKTSVNPGETLVISWNSTNQYHYFFYLLDELNRPTVDTTNFMGSGCKVKPDLGKTQGCLGQKNPAIDDRSVSWLVPTNLRPGKYVIKVAIWNKAEQAIDGSTAFTVNASSPSRYNLTVTTDQNGAVTSNPVGINCGNSNNLCSANFNINATVTLTATPKANYSFAGWSGNCAGTSSSCQVIMQADKNVTALFKAVPTTTPQPVNRTAEVLSAGSRYTCGIKADNKVACWGDNYNNQGSAPDSMFSQISAYNGHTCGIKTDGNVICWGDNSSGQTTSPVGTFSQVTVGGYHSCGVKTDGTVVCWGQNILGKTIPPAGTFTQVTAGSQHTCGIKTDGTLVCWGDNSANELLPPSGTFRQIDAGAFHTCGLKTDGTVVCWGDNTEKQLSTPSGTFSQVGSGWYYACGVRTDGTLTCWGASSYWKAQPPSGTFSQVSAGYGHSCALKTDGTVVCWSNQTYYGEDVPPTNLILKTTTSNPPTPGVTRYKLIINNDSNGAVVSSPVGINCGNGNSACTLDFDANITVTLTTTAKPGYNFIRWSGHCSGSTVACQLTMNEAKNVTAQFTPVVTSYRLSVTSNNGLVTSSPAMINCGNGNNVCSADLAGNTLVTLTAMPNPGFNFTGWSGDCQGTASCQLTMTGTKQVTAQFNVSRYPLTVTANNSGIVTSNPAGINCGNGNNLCNANFDANTLVTLTSSPNADFTFDGWNGDCGGKSCQLTMNAAKKVTAQFSQKITSYQLNVTSSNGLVTSSPAGINCGNGYTACNANFNANITVTLTANPSSGFNFTGWNGDCYGTYCQLTMNGNKNVNPQFTMNRYRLTVTPDYNGTVTSSPSGIDCGARNSDCTEDFNANTPVTLTASPNAGFSFVGWGGSCWGNSGCQVVMNGTQNVSVQFKSNITVSSVYPLTATLNQPTTFTVQGNNLPDSTAFFIADCANLYSFLGGNSTQRQFQCTPSYSTGYKWGVVKDQSGGKELFSFNVNVQGATPVVTSVSPTTATLNQPTTFTVQGSNLPDTTAFFIADCANLYSLGGNSTQRQFQCTPSYSTGYKGGVVKDKSGGTELRSFGITVQGSSSGGPPTVTSVSPESVYYNQSTVFTVKGSNLPDSTAFYIDYCASLTSLGGNANQRQFQCTPRYNRGWQWGVVKDKSGGNVLREFWVNVR